MNRCSKDLERTLSSLIMMAILNVPKKWRKKVFVALKGRPGIHRE